MRFLAGRRALELRSSSRLEPPNGAGTSGTSAIPTGICGKVSQRRRPPESAATGTLSSLERSLARLEMPGRERQTRDRKDARRASLPLRERAVQEGDVAWTS